MILYFCSKIIEENLTPNFERSDYFYPIVYPQKIFNNYSKKEVFFKTIRSYSKIDFTKVIFSIEFENDKNASEKEFADLVYSLWSPNKVELRFQRPSNLNDWKAETHYLKNKYGFNEPVLVAMNHDHPFVDYHPSAFNKIVDLVFDKDKSNLCKALYYSHAPEVINWLNGGKKKLNFTSLENGMYICSQNINWVDSIVVITFETLEIIWNSVKYSGDYIGRFDWVGVNFEKIKLDFFAYPREFFRHFDGYGHTTGVRLSSSLDLTMDLPFAYPSINNLQILIDFYYQLWLDNFVFSVEANLENNSHLLLSQKAIFIREIQKSIIQFENAYLDEDVDIGLLPLSQKHLVLMGLYNQIYYNGNQIYNQLNINAQLKSNWLKKPINQLIRLIAKIIIK